MHNVQVLSALSGLLPEEFHPASESCKSCNWLAFSDAGRAATDLCLQVGSSLWASGFTKNASALHPVYLSVWQGKALKVRRLSSTNLLPKDAPLDLFTQKSLLADFSLL